MAFHGARCQSFHMGLSGVCKGKVLPPTLQVFSIYWTTLGEPRHTLLWTLSPVLPHWMGIMPSSPWLIGFPRLSTSFLLRNSLPQQRLGTSLSGMFLVTTGHPVISSIASDQGHRIYFPSLESFLHCNGASVSLSSGYHLQSNGQAEWANQSLVNALRCVVA